MFGFNKGKPLIEGPIEFTAEVAIDRPVAEVFPLVDLADARFRHVQTGAQVRRVEGQDNRFDMIVDAVLERKPGERYALEAAMVPQLFALVKSVETHVFEAISDTKCRVILTTLATFDPDLSDEDIVGESAMMTQAVMGEMEKLKVLAEDGLDALKAMEEAEMDFEIDFDVDLDLGELDIDWGDIEPEQ